MYVCVYSGISNVYLIEIILLILLSFFRRSNSLRIRLVQIHSVWQNKVVQFVSLQWTEKRIHIFRISKQIYCSVYFVNSFEFFQFLHPHSLMDVENGTRRTENELLKQIKRKIIKALPKIYMIIWLPHEYCTIKLWYDYRFLCSWCVCAPCYFFAHRFNSFFCSLYSFHFLFPLFNGMLMPIT